MNDFDKSLQAKHSYKSYKAHFEPVYRAAQGFKIILLGISCIFSAYFFSAWTAFLGEYAIYGGAALSMLLAIIIGVFTEKVLVYWSAQRMVEPLLGAILFSSIALNIYADFNGAENLGAEIVGNAPIDSKTGEIGGIYQPQISSIDAQIDEIEAKAFYWCGTHSKAHKCPDAGFFVDKKQDRKAIAEIANLKAQKATLVNTMNTLLGDNGKAFNEALNAHSDNVTQSKSKMRFGSLICTFFYLAFSMWAHKYGLRAISETPITQSATMPGKKAKKGKKQPSRNKRKHIDSEPAFYDEYRNELTDDELAEELHAMREKERNAGK